MFCDLVDSTALAARLDPEEWREIVQAYQAVGAQNIEQYEGHIAQYLGDGLLVYFGYPTAHEDDAQRAVRSGLAIVEALQQAPLLQRHGVQVRIGIHTGLVVVGEIGGGAKREQLALGDTPNITARLQGLAHPNTLVMSDATQQLVAGLFDCDDLGLHPIKGISAPVQVYQVRGESGVRSRLEVASRRGLTPLIGREHEVQLLLDRWEQAKTGAGQVVLLSGEPGIGKSRLVHRMKEQGTTEGVTCIEFWCAPFFQNTAFAPVIEHLQHLLQFEREDSPAIKLGKLQHTLGQYRFPQADTLPLMAALLSLPSPAESPPLTFSPQKQKQRTEEALVAWLMEEAERQAVVTVWEDLHWADPSTVELLTLLLDQVPTTRLFVVLTARPEFQSPWPSRGYWMTLILNRLPRSQAALMVQQVTRDKAVPAEVLQQIVAKTDGVPLFIEELTKSVVEAVGAHGRAPLQSLDIPATLHDSLMARLDRLGPAKEIAQLGATIGREFRYELLHAVSPLDEATLQHGLKQLVEAELVYQRGLAPQAHYFFKHALIQDTAYQSLLKSTRQQYHRQIAQVLEEQFTEAKDSQPELLAHHYTEAGLIAQAIPYWQQAGERATQHSAYVEAISHLTKGLEVLKALPDTPERVQQELTLQITLGMALRAAKGWAAPEVEQAYSRARELCQQVGSTPQLFSALWGLWTFYNVRAELQTACELGAQCLHLAQSIQDPALLLGAHTALGDSLLWRGEFSSSQAHLEEWITLYDSQQSHPDAALYGFDLGGLYRGYAAWVWWVLGYPDHALERIREALTLAREKTDPQSLAWTWLALAFAYQLRREGQLAQERVEAAVALAREQGFPLILAQGMVVQGWVLTQQGQVEEGITHMRRGLAAWQATGTRLGRPYHLAYLAEACGRIDQPKEGLGILAEALTIIRSNGEGAYEAELYRLKGTLTLQSQTSPKQVSDKSQTSPRQVENKSRASQGQAEDKSEIADPRPLTPDPQAEAEAYFLKAIEIAQCQQAKSLELRAVMSLARLWQQQDKQAEAYQMLLEIYNWFTEGFDTKDLQEAKALLDVLKDSVERNA
jgi:class 3 adenylate cyclase/predicted ATPase